jgi:hypothetical protein
MGFLLHLLLFGLEGEEQRAAKRSGDLGRALNYLRGRYSSL